MKMEARSTGRLGSYVGNGGRLLHLEHVSGCVRPMVSYVRGSANSYPRLVGQLEAIQKRASRRSPANGRKAPFPQRDFWTACWTPSWPLRQSRSSLDLNANTLLRPRQFNSLALLGYFSCLHFVQFTEYVLPRLRALLGGKRCSSIRIKR